MKFHERLQRAKEKGVERTSDQREAVAGGGCGDIYDCPRCDKHVTDFTHYDQNGDKSKKITKGKCSNCGYEFEIDWQSKKSITISSFVSAI